MKSRARSLVSGVSGEKDGREAALISVAVVGMSKTGKECDTQATKQPARAKAKARERPMPWLAPVMRAVLPERGKLGRGEVEVEVVGEEGGWWGHMLGIVLYFVV